MRLRQDVNDGVDVVSVSGPVGALDAGSLLMTVQRLLDKDPRGVVLDLSGVDPLSDPAGRRLSMLTELPSGWPRTAVLVCPTSALPGLPAVMTAPTCAEALAQVEARAGRERTRVEVPHDATGPAHARAAVTRSAARLGLEGISDDVTLVVSEMVTNAVRHAAPPVQLEVEATEDAVVVAVWDASPQHPALRPADDSAEGGRGMLLVDLLTAEHGVRRQPPGKTVWARLERTAEAGS